MSSFMTLIPLINIQIIENHLELTMIIKFMIAFSEILHDSFAELVTHKQILRHTLIYSTNMYFRKLKKE